ncbi:unnamed protein product [Closterium sp. NIES-64]|nr:unnamed protein product [Closterium sp. NIES-64]
MAPFTSRYPNGGLETTFFYELPNDGPRNHMNSSRNRIQCPLRINEAMKARGGGVTVGWDRIALPATLAECGRMVLESPDPRVKIAVTHAAHRLLASGAAAADESAAVGSQAAEAAAAAVGVATAPPKPARPARPELVHPRAIPKPGPSSPLPWPAHMLHNLAHVELNAIDLAWDTVVRFSALGAEGEGGDEEGEGGAEEGEGGAEEGERVWSGRGGRDGEEEGRRENLEQSWKLPRQFFLDFVHVADDESRHLAWCLQRLEEMGHRWDAVHAGGVRFSYGDMPAHNLLWRDCEKSANHVQDRLAVIPMVQEARGLDAGPRLVERLVGLGDNRSAAVVAKIAQEEVAHVAVGVAWFVWVCERMGVDPQTSFTSVIRSLCADGVKGPFNHAARASAGLPRHWYDPQQPATAAPLNTVTSSTAADTPASVTPVALTSAHGPSLDSSGVVGGVKEGTGVMVEKRRSGQQEVGKKWRKLMSGQVNRAAREKMRDQLQRKAARIEAHIQRLTFPFGIGIHASVSLLIQSPIAFGCLPKRHAFALIVPSPIGPSATAFREC